MIRWLKAYVLRLLIALDQFANTMLGGAPDETISSRWGRTQGTSRISRWGCVCLNWLDPGHCTDAVEFTPDGQPAPHHMGRKPRV